MSEKSLKDFGLVIESIGRVEVDVKTRVWAFLQYISLNHPDILTVKLESSMNNIVQSILAEANPSSVDVTPIGTSTNSA